MPRYKAKEFDFPHNLNKIPNWNDPIIWKINQTSLSYYSDWLLQEIEKIKRDAIAYYNSGKNEEMLENQGYCKNFYDKFIECIVDSMNVAESIFAANGWDGKLGLELARKELLEISETDIEYRKQNIIVGSRKARRVSAAVERGYWKKFGVHTWNDLIYEVFNIDPDEESKLINHKRWEEILKNEWDYRQNKKSPEDYSYSSAKKVSWKCVECKYGWKSRIFSRTVGRGKGLNCPNCAGKIKSKNILSKHQRWVDRLKDEWDYQKNTGIDPNKITFGSHKKVHWICKECKKKWVAIIKNRVSSRGGTNCPICSLETMGRPTPTKSNILTEHPHWNNILKDEWDYEKNKLLPEIFSYASGKIIYWKCKKCRYRWQAAISSRTIQNSGCHACSGRIVSDKNRLTNHYRWREQLSEEWDYKLNKVKPYELSFGTTMKVNWICSECGYKWISTVNSRTSRQKNKKHQHRN